MAESGRDPLRLCSAAALAATIAIAVSQIGTVRAKIPLQPPATAEEDAAITRVLAREPGAEAAELLDHSKVHGKEFGAQSSFSGPQTVYCVRLCDGYYFPLPRRAGAVRMSKATICSAMCPAARTAVFNGRVIDHAISADGRKYKSLTNAFLYRKKAVENCACEPATPAQTKTAAKGRRH